MQRHKNAMAQVSEAVGRGRRRARSVLRAGLIAVLAAGVPLAGGTQAQSAEESQGVGEWQVSFENIKNKNESKTAQACTGDKEKYTLRGSLVGPSGVRSGQVDAVTLYVPGSGDGSTWHFTAATTDRGVDHITEMAKLGHASVYLHPLGYGPSDPVDGFAVCFGTYADMTKQVIQQLRTGSYSINGSAPEFKRVALAGHSGGGIIAELTQVSFQAADALIVAGWTGNTAGAGVADDGDPLIPVPYGALVRKEEQCATAPESKWGEDGPSGWARLFNAAEMDVLFYNMNSDVQKAFARLYELDACGYHDDTSQTLAANFAVAPFVEVPVLVGSGEYDPIAPPAAVKLQRARYALLDNDDVTSFEIPDSAHQVMMNNSAPVFREILHLWLEDHGF